MVQIRRIEIQGFRAFGPEPQALELRGPLSIVWGPNSQGKTSLAEAIEFLLTGETVRRELLASATREFSGSLRNVHLAPAGQVVVRATIDDGAGALHTVERRLVKDYTGRDRCVSQLKVDDVVVTDLVGLKIALSQPPLPAPILMQHTLRYVVSAEPQKRTDYFKALLEVSDLEEIRSAVADSKEVLKMLASPIGAAFMRCSEEPRLAGVLDGLRDEAPSSEHLAKILQACLGVMLADMGPLPETLEESVRIAREELQRRREAVFPLGAFEAGPVPTLTAPRDSEWAALEEFVKLRSTVDEQTVRLGQLFASLLAVPEVAGARAPMACPVCETREALTPGRIQAIRTNLEATAAFRRAEEAASSTLGKLTVLAEDVERGALSGRPAFVSWDAAECERRGFTEASIGGLLGAGAEDMVRAWNDASVPVRASLSDASEAIQEVRNELKGLAVSNLTAAKLTSLREKVSRLVAAGTVVVEGLESYRQCAAPLVQSVRQEIDRRGHTELWQEVTELIDHREALRDWLIGKTVREGISRAIDKALEDIDEAKGKILDDKFTQLGDGIAYWWGLLRPEEPTSFGGIERGGTGRRFIDLKARLATQKGGRSDGVMRDAVAVLSDSQLNCLGLSAFLARAAREGVGFVVLDDPVPASDEEHRAMFVDGVLKALVDVPMQVILMTHDERLWKDVQGSYGHLALDTYLITLDDPSKGAVVENRSDTLDALMTRATPYVDNVNPDTRKIAAGRLRDAAERFCKVVLVERRRQQGDTAAAISSYDSWSLLDLVRETEPLLGRDPSHPGKLRMIGQRLNPGAHDDKVPPPGDLRVCLGDLKKLRQDYVVA